MIDFPKTAQGAALLATSEDLIQEGYDWYLANGTYDWYLVTTPDQYHPTSLEITVDSGEHWVPNIEFGYTNPNLHRRIDQDYSIPADSNYLLARYQDYNKHLVDIRTPENKNIVTEDSEPLLGPYIEHGDAYKQTFQIGVWGYNSYRTTQTYIHDEESTTCEIP